MVEAEPLHRVERQPDDGARRRRLLAAGRLDPRLGDGREVGDEAAGRAVRFAPRPGGRQLGQAGEAEEALGDLRLGGEEALAAQADGLDQPPHEDVGAPLLHHPGGGVVELEEGLDPLARLGLELGRVERRLAAGDHVELAPAGDRRQPGEVAGAQFDRRPGQRASRGGRVVGVGEHAQPGDRVAHLGALEERGRAGRGGRGSRAPPSPRRPRRPRGPASARRTQMSSARVPPASRCSTSRAGRLRLRALVGALPEAQLRLAEAALEGDDLAVGVEDRYQSSRPSLPLSSSTNIWSGLSPASPSISARWAARRLLQLVDHHLGEALGDPGPHVGPLDQQARRGRGRRRRGRGSRTRPGSGRGSRRARRTRPRAAPSRARPRSAPPRPGARPARRGSSAPTRSRLQRVDPRQQARQQPGRVAADLVAAQRQRVEAVEQDREPLRPPEHVEEGVEPGRLGVLAQEALAELVPGADPELLIRGVEQRLAVVAQPPRGAAAGAEDQRAVAPPSRPPRGRRAAAPAARSCPSRRRRARAAGRRRGRRRAPARPPHPSPSDRSDASSKASAPSAAFTSRTRGFPPDT